VFSDIYSISYSPQTMTQTRSHSKVPAWLKKFVHLFEGGASLVGPVCSCEVDTHIQTWMMLFDLGIAKNIKLHLLAACAPNLPWAGAISLSEVGASVELLGKGLALASIHPHFPLFTDHHRSALRNGVTELRDKLFDCSNPLVGKGGLAFSRHNLSDIVFAKYGGEIWRQGLISPLLHSNIMRFTQSKFPSARFDTCREGDKKVLG
jgi:hypothetical protein